MYFYFTFTQLRIRRYRSLQSRRGITLRWTYSIHAKRRLMSRVTLQLFSSRRNTERQIRTTIIVAWVTLLSVPSFGAVVLGIHGRLYDFHHSSYSLHRESCKKKKKYYRVNKIQSSQEKSSFIPDPSALKASELRMRIQRWLFRRKNRRRDGN